MDSLPDPKIVKHEGILVVRDDLIQGGTKARVLPLLFNDIDVEYVYASPVQGYAQVALAYCARTYGKRATVFCAKRKDRHPRTLEAMAAGATIFEVFPGYLSVVQKRARDYCYMTRAKLLPFGLDTPEIMRGISRVAASLRIIPKEVWVAAGSGLICRSLALQWPEAAFHAVQVGKGPLVGAATLWAAPERFGDTAEMPPPFPSCGNYDAKVWQFIKKYASQGALFWNVAR